MKKREWEKGIENRGDEEGREEGRNKRERERDAGRLTQLLNYKF